MMDSESQQQPQPEAAKAPVPPPMAEKKRRRPPLSCEQCRKRKIRCDRTQPCANCVKSNIPSCTYAPYHVPAWRTKKMDAIMGPSKDSAADGTGRASLRNLQAAEPRPDAHNPDTSEISPSNIDSSAILSSKAGSSSTSSSPNVDWLVSRVQQLEEKLAKALRINDAPDGLKKRPSAQETGEPPEGFVAKSRYFAHSHWIYGLSMVSRFAPVSRCGNWRLATRANSDSLLWNEISLVKTRSTREIYISLLVDAKSLGARSRGTA